MWDLEILLSHLRLTSAVFIISLSLRKYESIEFPPIKPVPEEIMFPVI